MISSMNWLSHIGKQASRLASIELFRYIGPGFFVTVAFIDPGNWVTNVAAGSQYGYKLLWVATLATVILTVVQHNAAHLGIVTGLCLSEAASKFFRPWLRILMLGSALAACVSTALAELLGAAIGINMLTGAPIPFSAIISACFAGYMLMSKNYRRLENWIMGFVGLIGLSFLFELSLTDISWYESLRSSIIPVVPTGSMIVIMGVLGAVVMPHTIFLHSEVIQSRQWNQQGEDIIRKQLKYEFFDTLVGMSTGWAINCAMIIMAAAVFHAKGITVNELSQVTITLRPLFGNFSSLVFALGLLFAGLSSSIVAAMAGGSIFAGIYQEPFDMRDNHSRFGIGITLIGALIVIFFLHDPFKGILWSQVALSLQLPFTIVPLILLTSSQEVMGAYANTLFGKIVLWIVGVAVIFLNGVLLWDMVT